MNKVMDDMTKIDERRVNIKTAEDVFLDFFGLHRPGDRFNLYDLIIDCRHRLFGITFEECKDALHNISKAGIVRTGMVNNQYILTKDKNN